MDWNGHQIRVSYIHPPIPSRQFDWCCWLDGLEERTSWYGYGRTRGEALDDLLETLYESQLSWGRIK